MPMELVRKVLGVGDRGGHPVLVKNLASSPMGPHAIAPSAILQVLVSHLCVPSIACEQEEGGLTWPCWSSHSKGETNTKTKKKMTSEGKDGVYRVGSRKTHC